MTLVVWTYKWCTTLVVFDREREDSLYSPAGWLLGEWLAWLPVNVRNKYISVVEANQQFVAHCAFHLCNFAVLHLEHEDGWACVEFRRLHRLHSSGATLLRCLGASSCIDRGASSLQRVHPSAYL